MDRDKLKSTGSRVRARGGKSAEKATKVSDALGSAPITITLKGRSFVIEQLTFNDLVRVETDRGDVGQFLQEVTSLRLEALRYFFWLLFQKSDEITLSEVGELLPIQELEMAELLVKLLTAAGLTSGDDSGNGATPATDPLTGA